MKYSKFFLAACLAAFALNASAQDETVETTEPTASMSTKSASKGDYDHGYHLMPEIKLGGYNGVFGFGANLVLEHEFHRYFAWDIVSLDASAPYDFSEGCVGLKTGLRYFTPRFWGGKVRGFVGAAAGYQCCIKQVVDYYDPDEIWTSKTNGVTRGRFHLNRKPLSGLGVSASIGIQIKKHNIFPRFICYNHFIPIIKVHIIKRGISHLARGIALGFIIIYWCPGNKHPKSERTC